MWNGQFAPYEDKNKPEDIKFICDHLGEFFKEEPYKVALWLFTVNPNFGGFPPAYLIMLGRAHKVRQFIEASKDGD